MKTAIICIIGLLGSLGQVAAESLVEGRVRLPSGAPVPGAQVLLFDLTDLRAAPLAATTDGSGHFTLHLGTSRGLALPERFELGANYPNPFNPSTMIPYQLPASMHVRLEVFNILGQRIATLVDGERSAGFHTASWDATDAAGRAVGAGVYLYRLSGDGVQATRSMLLIDGQAGTASADPARPAAARDEAGQTAPVYGLTVSGPGLVPYVDPAFRVEAGMAPLDLVVEGPGNVPSAKVASGGILGDVDNTGGVDFFDALLVALYSLDASVVMPNNGDISLGDVNADGQVDLSDAWVIAAWLNDPSDPSIPSGIGEPVGAALASLSPDPSTVTFADDGGWHRFTVEAGEPVSVVANPEGTGRRLEITTRSGRGNFCPAEAEDDVSRQDGQTLYLSGCSSGQATVELRRESDGTVLRTYTFEVTGIPADLVVESVSVSDSTLTPGQSFTLSATVRNQGTAGAEATTLRWYRSSNRTISTRDTQVGSDAVGALAAEGTGAESISLTAPSTEGTYYYGACVESLPSERGGNNCSAGVRVTVEAGSPDLIVASVSVSESSLTTGESFTLHANVRNQGPREAPATTLRWYRSSDATITTRDTEVGTSQVGGLFASGAGAESISVTAPSSEGTYFYGACVESVAGEADTGNNCSIGVRVNVEEPDTTPVTIPDASLRAVIEAALGKASGAPITVTEMKGLTSLEAVEKGISDLTGLETAANLKGLVIWGNRITDISPLSGLINLTELSVGEGPISDLSPLSGLSRLRSLVVFGTSNTDLSPLSGLTNLRELGLNHGEIEDISALAGLTNLRRLNIFDNQIEDISVLSGLTNLTHLTCSKNRVSDISALSGLTNLTELWLTDNNIKDVSPLSGLINLIWLGLSANIIEDISPLSGLTNLYYLGLSANNIEDISPLSGLTNLYYLELRGNPYETLPKGDFDIELVLLDDFTESEKNVLQYVARRWMAVVTKDLPDYEFTEGWSGGCGSQSFEIPAGERIDDLRIYVVKAPSVVGPHGFAALSVLREATHLPVIGCMGFDLSHANLLITGLHEIGHVLGVGTRVWDNLGFRQDPNGDEHFNGPLAIAAFDDAGGRNYTGAKVPVDGSHWRVGVFGDELMTPTGSGAISAITVQSLADLGYGVDVSQADPYTLPGAAGKASAKTAAAPSIPGVDSAPAHGYSQPGVAAALFSIPNDRSREWIGARGFDLGDDRMTGRLAGSSLAVPDLSCGADLLREPIHVVDPQGRILRTLGK